VNLVYWHGLVTETTLKPAIRTSLTWLGNQLRGANHLRLFFLIVLNMIGITSKKKENKVECNSAAHVCHLDYIKLYWNIIKVFNGDCNQTF